MVMTLPYRNTGTDESSCLLSNVLLLVNMKNAMTLTLTAWNWQQRLSEFLCTCGCLEDKLTMSADRKLVVSGIYK